MGSFTILQVLSRGLHGSTFIPGGRGTGTCLKTVSPNRYHRETATVISCERQPPSLTKLRRALLLRIIFISVAGNGGGNAIRRSAVVEQACEEAPQAGLAPLKRVTRDRT